MVISKCDTHMTGKGDKCNYEEISIKNVSF